MKAIITVSGKDKVGIIAGVATRCAAYSANIVDISQTVLSGYFVMSMLVVIDELKLSFSDFADNLQSFGKENELEVRVMHEDIFEAMHHI